MQRAFYFVGRWLSPAANQNLSILSGLQELCKGPIEKRFKIGLRQHGAFIFFAAIESQKQQCPGSIIEPEQIKAPGISASSFLYALIIGFRVA